LSTGIVIEDGNGAGRARIEATRNGARPAPVTTALQQARSTHARNGIGDVGGLALEDPARHCNA